MDSVAQKKGSVVGGILLIAGSCIGAGMLGLPILTGMAGFLPSLLMFVVACFFMTTTALLLVEVDQWFAGRSNFITMVSEMLGGVGRVLCWVLYLFLFYALLIAYIAGSGNHVVSFFPSSYAPHPWVGSLFFVIIFGGVVYLGTRSVDLCNRVLMAGKIIAFVALIYVGFLYIKPEALLYTDAKYAFFPLPILIISFGFHNMIPTLSDYLGGDIKRIKQAIVGGAFFALFIYLFWQIIALGDLPVQGDNGILDSYKKGFDAAQALKEYVKAPWIGSLASILAFFAILTSFLAQTLSLVHFLGDGFKIKQKQRENIWLAVLALVPPLIFAILKPSIFYAALNFAGGICAVILFGILPVMMVWKGRYQRNNPSTYTVQGGKRLLVGIFCIALFIVFYQLTQMCNLDIFPTPT